MPRPPLLILIAPPLAAAGPAHHALKQLGQVMENCVACHALYRLETL